MQTTGDPGVTSSVRLHRVLLAAAVMVPGLLFGAAAWQNREDVLREGRDAIQRTAAVMQEHGRKVFETAELAIGQVDERIDDHDWERIGAASTSGFLHRLCAPMDQLVSIWIADADGRVRAGSQAWTPGSGIAGRDFFQAQKAADRGTYIGAAFTGAATSAASFAIIRRRTMPGGVFDGTIHAAASPDYFTRFYAEAAPPIAHVALLIRDDGAVLAREPADPAAVRTLAPGTPVMRHLATGEVQAGLLSDISSTGVPQDYAIRKIGAYPLYVVFAVPRAVLLERWYRNLRAYGAVAAAAALTLLVVSWLALRRAQAEEAALVRLRGEIAQRQAAEQQLRHAQRMDAVGQLTGGIAHDFNNLLTAILGNLELITRAARSLDGGEKVGRLAGTAMKAVQRGSALTKSLLAFSRKQPLLARPMDANALLADFIELVRQAVGVPITVTLVPAPGLPACVADPAELEAAILNLAINARDAMPGGGRIEISTGVAALSAEALAGNPEARPGRFVSVRVADTGSGMPPEVAGKAFEPFFTTKPVGQGTGLGLSQVFGFVRQLGGHVTIESTPGQGTAITLFLPVADG